ncbi:hypothetical protein MC45_01155 [Sphingomonas taxi]|uniref:Uncharacterized protein n=1 Tax=Sphingomonas taxi TaxID=1549858 RepID=A0A097ECG3_9SPHN|nr:hypothetical protein MC45_01155 [Sphingomonas taxi]
MPYGDRQGEVRDPAGNIWWVSQRTTADPYSDYRPRFWRVRSIFDAIAVIACATRAVTGISQPMISDP